MSVNTKQVFQASYFIGDESLMGGVSFTVNLIVNPEPIYKVVGFGQISNTTYPPLKLETKLDGDLIVWSVTPGILNYRIKATGTLITKSSQDEMSATAPNVELEISFNSDFNLGTANYKYIGKDGQWHSLEQVPVKSIPGNALK